MPGQFDFLEFFVSGALTAGRVTVLRTAAEYDQIRMCVGVKLAPVGGDLVADLHRLGPEGDPSLYAADGDKPRIVADSVGLVSDYKPANAGMPVPENSRLAIDLDSVGVIPAENASITIECRRKN
jgi:hypothetical protein